MIQHATTSTLEPPSARPRIAVAAETTRLGELVGDRPCAACHFNLSGQTIHREPHYGLLMVRCPECGTAAALQEYPFLGRWATRLGYLGAGLWLLIVLAALAITAACTWGMTQSLVQEMTGPYTAHVQKVWQDYTTAQGPPNPYTYSNYTQNQQWWDSLDKSQLFMDAGGWSHAIAWSALWNTLGLVLILGALGVLLSVIMPHARWKVRALVLLFIGLLISACWWTDAITYRNAYSYYGGIWVAWRSFIPTLGIGLALFGLVCIALGMWVGRPVARRLITLLLPPRLRGPLGFLWAADHLPMPR